jgi:hypothetical protein
MGIWVNKKRIEVNDEAELVRFCMARGLFAESIKPLFRFLWRP